LVVSVHDDIVAARTQALALLTDAVSIGEPVSGTGTGGRYGSGPRTAYQARTTSPVPALIQSADVYSGTSSTPDRDVALTEYVVKVPAGTTIMPGDKVVPLESSLFPSLVGSPLIVLRVGRSSVAVLQRCVCQRVDPVKARP
jgi:hypothetical protein